MFLEETWQWVAKIVPNIWFPAYFGSCNKSDSFQGLSVRLTLHCITHILVSETDNQRTVIVNSQIIYIWKAWQLSFIVRAIANASIGIASDAFSTSCCNKLDHRASDTTRGSLTMIIVVLDRRHEFTEKHYLMLFGKFLTVCWTINVR